MIHYHGTPITPRRQLDAMAGRHFCVSFARPQNLRACLAIGQSVLFDNGAFSAFTRGEVLNPSKFYRWIEPVLQPPHFAVIPDVIGGTEQQQRDLVAQWPFGWLGAPVWHLDKPIAYLLDLAGQWPRVCLGSAGEYWDVGGERWCARMDEVFNALEQLRIRPWIHGLRMLGQIDGGWPLASADSTNVAQNFKRDTGCANCKAARLDAKQTAGAYDKRGTQQDIFADPAVPA